MHGKINILVHGSIEEDADDYLGAIIEDYDEKKGILHLFVDPDEVQSAFIMESETEETEAWGQIATRNIVDIVVLNCTWNDHEIINDEDVCWELIKSEGGATTWH
jgi:hypothetical protein